MWIPMNAIDRSVTERRKGAETMMALLILSFVFLLQFQSVHSFSRSAVVTNPRRIPSSGCLTTLELGRRRNKSGDGDNNIGNISNNKNVNSNTATVPGYTFFQRSGRQDGDKSTKEKLGYVPSGMSREEYAAIRKMEADKERKMNYGAWGPRFFRTDRPDGDWMVMPNLWTFGQVDNNSRPFSNDVNGENGGSRYSLRRRIQFLAETHGPAFLVGYILVDVLCLGYALWKLKQMQESAVLQKASGIAYAAFRLFLSGVSIIADLPPTMRLIKAPIARKTIKSSILEPAAVALMKMSAFKITIAMLQIPLWNRLMELTNRRWLWSKKRFTTTISSVAMAGVTLFGMIVCR